MSHLRASSGAVAKYTADLAVPLISVGRVSVLTLVVVVVVVLLLAFVVFVVPVGV